MTEKQKVKEITDKLEVGLKSLFESDKYKSYLSTMSKFHNYSANNIQLIEMQYPGASYVAGYQAWQKNFSRYVNKGEKAIRILAPAPYRIKEEREKFDPDTGEMIIGENGMPQKEEVEIKIPAYRVVSVFDVAQTDGEPLPELEAKELLATVEGYGDFKQAIMNAAPVPIVFEDIPGDMKGYFNRLERKIYVQENMAESQTLKTMIHEAAHSILHDQKVNIAADREIVLKDRNTEEVEAESIAFTVCQHFGIDTSDYSFGYIAGWSTGRDMKELKSSLDTIRRTASEIITGIEAQLQELQINREMEQMPVQEFILAVTDTERLHFDIISVTGMDGMELLDSLRTMTDADREDVETYLKSRGAGTIHLGDDKSEDVDEFHVDYIYDTNTHEITDVKYEMEMDKKVNEPIQDSDVILKIMYVNEEYEIGKITNMTQNQALDLAHRLAGLHENDRGGNIQGFMKEHGAEYIPIIVSNGRNSGMPEFFDIAVDLKDNEVFLEKDLSGMEYAASILHRLEHGKSVFTPEERNLIVNYGYKLDDYEKTKELAEILAYRIEYEPVNEALTVIDAQAEIDALPDGMIGLSEMHEYGYIWDDMLPLTKETALELFGHDLAVYQLHEDGSKTFIEGEEQITEHEGIFGIEKEDWESERNFRSMQEKLMESGAIREAQLLYGDTDKYGIYQLKNSPELRDFYFAGTAELLKRGILSDDFKEIQPKNYNLVYVGALSEMNGYSQEEKLNAVYEKFNIDHPADYEGHSLSVSDIVVLHEKGENRAHFVDSLGFTELPDFIRELESRKEQDAERIEQKLFPAVYGHSRSYAIEHEEIKEYRESRSLNRACKEAIEEVIRQNFDGMHLKDGIVKPLMEQYGSERIEFVLANTLQQKAWDGRFSNDNKEWASKFSIPENIMDGIDLNCELTVGSHSTVLDGFIDMFRGEVLEQEKRMDISRPEGIQENVSNTFGQNTQELEDIEDGDEIIDLGDEVEQVLAELRKSLTDSKDTVGQDAQKLEKVEQEEATETELAFQISDHYISIQETEGGYDYSIIGADYKVIDGGVYDNPDVSIQEALEDIVDDLKSSSGYKDERIPIDYAELMEKVEEADRIVPTAAQRSVTDIFRERTNELFHKINKTSASEIEEIVKCCVQAQIDEDGIDAVIVDAVVAGSRCRGLERKGSDLDVVVELSTNEREDYLFNILNEDKMYIGNIDIDINPITAQQTGTLESYLPQAEEYLAELSEARKHETEVTFTVAECGEFHNLGEFHKDIPTVEKAVAVWKQIPPERMHGRPAIGINVHRPGTDPIEDVGVDILCGKRIDLAILEYVPDIKDNPKAMELIAELVAKFPEMEIDGKMSEKMEARVWEKRMADLEREETKKEQDKSDKPSLKSRLMEKKAFVSDREKDKEEQENKKNNQREM